MGMKTPCLGAHSGSLKKTLVAQTHNLGAPGARVPVRQQPCLWFFWCFSIFVKYYFQVSFNLTVILSMLKITQNTVIEPL